MSGRSFRPQPPSRMGRAACSLVMLARRARCGSGESGKMMSSIARILAKSERASSWKLEAKCAGEGA